MARHCPDCGTEAMASDRACLRCGTPLPSGLGLLLAGLFGGAKGPDNRPSPRPAAFHGSAKPEHAKPEHAKPGGRTRPAPTAAPPVAPTEAEEAGRLNSAQLEAGWAELMGAPPSAPLPPPALAPSPKEPQAEGPDWRSYEELRGETRPSGDTQARFREVQEAWLKERKGRGGGLAFDQDLAKALDLPKRLEALRQGESPFPKRPAWVAPVASYLLPGLGQALQGRWQLGLVFWLVWWGGIHGALEFLHSIDMAFPGEITQLLWGWGPTAWVFWTVYHAHLAEQRRAQAS